MLDKPIGELMQDCANVALGEGKISAPDIRAIAAAVVKMWDSEFADREVELDKDEEEE